MPLLRSTPTSAQVRLWLSAPESERLARKSSLKHPERVRDTVCAFANDLDGSDEPGILLLGVSDQGEPLHPLIPDELLAQQARAAEEQARAAVLDLCEVLGLELTEEQKAEMVRMDLSQLAALRSHLKQNRCWPLSTK